MSGVRNGRIEPDTGFTHLQNSHLCDAGFAHVQLLYKLQHLNPKVIICDLVENYSLNK